MVFVLLDKLIQSETEMSVLNIGVIIIALIIISFHLINRKFQGYNRMGLIAFILSLVFPGSGFAYSVAYIRAWLTFGLLVFIFYSAGFADESEVYFNAFAVIYIVQIIWSTIYAINAGRKLRLKNAQRHQKLIEQSYLNDLKSYIGNGYHVAVDTNFLMHFFTILEDLYKQTNVHLFLHPTVFGELEGLKGHKKHEVRWLAQRGFDLLEMYQKGERMQWTRRQKVGQNFSSADQRIVTGVLTEIQHGVKLVFASHDKGARVLARSLNIPVVDPIDTINKKIS